MAMRIQKSEQPGGAEHSAAAPAAPPAVPSTPALGPQAPRVDACLGTGAASVLYDPQWDVAHRYGTDQLPETYLVVHGHIVEKFIGEVNWDDPTVRQKIASRLTGGTSGAAGTMAGSS